jgi:ubiquinone biosynthesis monooxygenase Coq7
MQELDALIIGFDRALRTLFAPAIAVRATPGEALPEPAMSEAERRHAAGLMRVNHTGEICAQALYQGQALTARNEDIRRALEKAAAEETEHLAWTAQRVEQLGGRLSLLNPVFYSGAFAMGALSGLCGDKWNLGFLAETEKQVEGHLDRHLGRLPSQDTKSRAIVAQMKEDEAGHARVAMELGGSPLPEPVRAAMRTSARVMTSTTYRI